MCHGSAEEAAARSFGINVDPLFISGELRKRGHLVLLNGGPIANPEISTHPLAQPLNAVDDDVRALASPAVAVLMGAFLALGSIPQRRHGWSPTYEPQSRRGPEPR